MRLDELQAWIQSANHVECACDRYDDSGNRQTEEIYEKDGQFYRLGFMNGYPHLHTTAIGTTIKGDYEDPTPVRRALSLILHTEWIE